MRSLKLRFATPVLRLMKSALIMGTYVRLRMIAPAIA